MASSSCVKCGSGEFELTTVRPFGAALDCCFVQCSRCGGVVGVMEAGHIGSELLLIRARIDRVANKVGAH